MAIRKIAIVLLAVILTSACNSSAVKSGGWEPIFDGESLDGWTQLNGMATYKVQNGTIGGRTTEGSPNSFLCSDKDYGDFELEFDVKCDTGLNSGVQIRSRVKTEADVLPIEKNVKNQHLGHVFGPQIEIEASPGQAGYIYGEATGLKWLSTEPNSKDPKVNQHSYYMNDIWNHYRIVAKGPRIQTFINSTKVADLTHKEIYKTHPTGTIGLQVHGIKSGTGPYKVAWRNIRIRSLD